MPRPIPGARFIACLLGGAFLFGGAAALADAGRIGFTQFVAVPSALPGGLPIDPDTIAPTLAAAPDPIPAPNPAETPAERLAADADADIASAEVVADQIADASGEQLLAAGPAPRLRPSDDDAVAG
jgi:hypothetical protein